MPTAPNKIISTVLYYNRAVDSTMLMAINSISESQANSTTATAASVTWLLDYATTYPDATLRYEASQMILSIHSDASYQSETESRSCAGGHLFLVSPNYNNTKDINGAIHTTCEIIKNVMSAASEAKCGAIFINYKAAVPLRITLEEMGHPQPPTSVQIDNFTIEGIMNSAMQKNGPKQWTCAFIGCRIESNKNSLTCFGNQDQHILQIII